MIDEEIKKNIECDCNETCCCEDCECEELYPTPKLGDPAPEFTAVTTQGNINFPSDYSGKWVVFFSHPADFTPVCTTEFIEFGVLADDFEKMNCKFVGLSVDGIFSHIAWLRTIKEKIDYNGINNLEISFPLIADISMEVALKYGMIQPKESDTSAVRCVFFIDPKGIIRAIIYYPLALGRNFDEIKRVVIGLQTIDAFGVALPADWRPGDDVIVPAPNTSKGACQRVKESNSDGSMHCYDWFLCTKKIPKEGVYKKIEVK